MNCNKCEKRQLTAQKTLQIFELNHIDLNAVKIFYLNALDDLPLLFLRQNQYHGKNGKQLFFTSTSLERIIVYRGLCLRRLFHAVAFRPRKKVGRLFSPRRQEGIQGDSLSPI